MVWGFEDGKAPLCHGWGIWEGVCWEVGYDAEGFSGSVPIFGLDPIR